MSACDDLTGKLFDPQLGREILRRLRSTFSIDDREFIGLYVARREGDPFKVLVATILSQNTSEANAFRAYESLRERLGVSPEELSRAPVEAIEEAVKPAGLYRAKARAIKELARVVVHEGVDLRELLSRGEEEVRSFLSKIKGIGPKTIDVLLANWGYPVVPVDTHVRRVAIRLGLAPPNAGYEEVRASLERVFPPKERLEAHLLLIKLGRTLCRARRPRCNACPLTDICAFSQTCEKERS